MSDMDELELLMKEYEAEQLCLRVEKILEDNFEFRMSNRNKLLSEIADECNANVPF